MDANLILERIKRHPGAFLRVVVASPVPTLKSVDGVNVIKRSTLYVTAGTEFANRKDVREAIEAGERGEVGPLPWGEWDQYPYSLTHKGQTYVRLYPPTAAQLASFNLAPRVEWFANGEPISRDVAETYCGAKAKAREQDGACFAVNAANIQELG